MWNRRATPRRRPPNRSWCHFPCRSSTSWPPSDQLGPALLAKSGLDQDTAPLGTDVLETLATNLDDAPRATSPGVLLPTDKSLAQPIALGVDDWSLVWGGRLPATSVDRLTELVVADSYQPIDRSGAICVVAMFEAASPADAAFVLQRMQTWAAAAPAQSQATATQVDDTRVQLVTCDPGADASGSLQPGAAQALVAASDRAPVHLIRGQSRKLMNCSGMPMSLAFSNAITD